MADKRTAKKGTFLENISRDQAKDGGMAVVLILLILGMVLKQKNFYTYAMAALVVDMIIPAIYKPFAKLWFMLANFLGTIMSKVLLTVVYIVLVLPVGLIIRLLGKDSLKLNQFKKDISSVFKERNYQFRSSDIENPY
ncbi:MAG: hypothetical protein GTO45_32235 [Candidatus Aminicenantes bacterium]|nr:hypothetical protein [Candidatus Aminicenantes bacterium]NIM83436.1 hypothetical protein [Candidatus Aminicenantes bacterium]NIN22811.1 hypothetical protein [Candidatus Aminicenantes bacterium]NIN46545.1 hypothetical protein [Candidatus Aminicenantes bacterium]NIN89450.1 hypothetical protein [Candidatus Aminicenantes bacterium]